MQEEYLLLLLLLLVLIDRVIHSYYAFVVPTYAHAFVKYTANITEFDTVCKYISPCTGVVVGTVDTASIFFVFPVNSE